MLCPRCRNKIKPGETFCRRCNFQINQPTGVYKANNNSGSAPKPKHSKGAVIAGIISAVIVLATVITLILLLTGTINPNESAGDGVDGASFSTELMPGFVFDDIQVIHAAGVAIPDPTVTKLMPASGTVGAKIQISGSNLAGAGLQAVKLGETEMNILSVSNETIEVYLPYGAQSANIMLEYTNQTVDAGAFEVLPQQKKLLVKQSVSPSVDTQTVSTNEISLTLPGNVLDANQTVRIERIAEVNPVNLPESVTGTAFSITVGDVHQFNDTLTIEYTPSKKQSGEMFAVYFDEETSLWNVLPSKMVDGKLRIYTNHLTDIYVSSGCKAIYSSERSFRIFYYEKEAFNYGNSIDDLALKTAIAMEEARKEFDKKLPAEYCVKFKEPMFVILDGSGGVDQAGKYDASANIITMPTHFNSEDKFKAMAAHELFHAYQNVKMNAYNMGRSTNKWAVEAIAELSAYELVLEQKRDFVNASYSQDPYYKLNSMHEYDMSCFLQHLLRKTNSSFEDMWVSIASNSKSSLVDSLNDFFKSKSSDFYSLELSYLDFWQDVVGDKEAPELYQIGMLFDGREVSLTTGQHNAKFEYTPIEAATTAFGSLKASGFSQNVPLRIFNVECTSKNASCAKISGVRLSNRLNNARVLGGHDWRPVYADHASIGSRRLYSLKQGSNDMVLIAMEAVREGMTHSVEISEIQAQCMPKKIENAIPGMEQEFKVQFKDIFDYVGDMELIVNFGDGTSKRFTKVNENGLLGGTLKHTFGDQITGSAVTFSLYDISGGEKQLVSQLVIPITKGQAVTLSASPNPAQPGDTVSLSANITDAGYTYQWDFGDGQTATTYDTYTNHVYDNPGVYTATVTLLDLDDTKYGTAKTTVTVAEPQTTPTPTASAAPTPSQAADHSYLLGRWRAPSNGVCLDMETGNTWRTDSTLELYADGTCYYNLIVTIVYNREDDPNPNPTMQSYDGKGRTPESESLTGKWGLYDEEGFTGNIGGIEFEDGSGGYIRYEDGKLIFNRTAYTKAG